MAFHCPGCGYDHAFTVGAPGGNPRQAQLGAAAVHPVFRPGGPRPRWSWNGSLESPTFTPSILCNKDIPECRCHSFVTNGKIIFQNDCFHALKGKTVDLPDWDETA